MVFGNPGRGTHIPVEMKKLFGQDVPIIMTNPNALEYNSQSAPVGVRKENILKHKHLATEKIMAENQ